MPFWVLPISGIPVSATTLQRLTRTEQQTDKWQAIMTEYDATIDSKLDAQSAEISKVREQHITGTILDLENNDPEFIRNFNRVIKNNHVLEADQPVPDGLKSDVFDPYVTMEVGLPRGSDGSLKQAHVKRQCTDDDGKPIGVPNSNPLLDSREYKVVYLDVTTEVMTAKIIANNILSQVNNEGHRHMMLD